MSDSMTGRRIAKDSNGITTIYVNEEDLADFPNFMRFVLNEKLGLDEGVLKDVYGYREKVVNPMKAKSNRNSFINEVKVLLERSLDSLLDYYWATIRRLSIKSNGMDFQEDVVDMHSLIEVAKTQRQLYGLENCTVESTPAAECSHLSHVSQSEKEDNKFSILYAAGVPVGDADCKITHTFSLSSLKTILDVIPTKIPGFSSPYLYFGMEMSSFGWHIEDIAAFSLNALHYGAPCIWFVVPPPYFKLFKEWSNNFFLDRGHVACSNVLGASHKYVMASVTFLRELGIPANIVVQEEREIVLLYPYAAHSGFKTGLDVQQAVNFLDPWSVELSIFAPTCECYDSCVQIDLKEVIALVRPDLLKLYLDRDLRGLITALKDHKYLQKIGILPSLPNEDSEKSIISCQ
ncbi:Lysine-specific demethylase 4E [Frankliniella fusca]|uniref:Lysine-specific demethylase 4E n=1 Tax=Frankliniella fusca TaxID=407009 RepID=A0AAE1H936_9NEOP|nr:Lysine-specific demethylase 4E [Frankliniella fusca]